MDYTVTIKPKDWQELIELTEEPRVCELIDQSLSLLRKSYQYATSGYHFGMVPMSNGRQDLNKPIVFFDL